MKNIKDSFLRSQFIRKLVLFFISIFEEIIRFLIHLKTLNLKKNKKIYFFALSFSIIIFLFLFLKAIIEPTAYPSQVKITNKTDTHVTISWITYGIKTKGSVEIIPSDKSKFSTIINDIIKADYKDKRDQESKNPLAFIKTKKRYITHYVEIDNLEPEKEYTILIKSGNKKYEKDISGRDISWVKTFSEETALREPLLSYGEVRTQKSSPATDSIAYIKLLNNMGQESYLLSALVNSDGKYMYDITNARYSDGSGLFPIENVEEIIMMEGADKGRALELANSKMNKPIRLIELYDEHGGDYKYKTTFSEKIEFAQQSIYSYINNLIQPEKSYAQDNFTLTENENINNSSSNAQLSSNIVIETFDSFLFLFSSLLITTALLIKNHKILIKKLRTFNIFILATILILNNGGIKILELSFPLEKSSKVYAQNSNCGNGICESHFGETKSSCPSDCKEITIVKNPVTEEAEEEEFAVEGGTTEKQCDGYARSSCYAQGSHRIWEESTCTCRFASDPNPTEPEKTPQQICAEKGSMWKWDNTRNMCINNDDYTPPACNSCDCRAYNECADQTCHWYNNSCKSREETKEALKQLCNQNGGDWTGESCNYERKGEAHEKNDVIACTNYTEESQCINNSCNWDKSSKECYYLREEPCHENDTKVIPGPSVNPEDVVLRTYLCKNGIWGEISKEIKKGTPYNPGECNVGDRKRIEKENKVCDSSCISLYENYSRGVWKEILCLEKGDTPLEIENVSYNTEDCDKIKNTLGLSDEEYEMCVSLSSTQICPLGMRAAVLGDSGVLKEGCEKSSKEGFQCCGIFQQQEILDCNSNLDLCNYEASKFGYSSYLEMKMKGDMDKDKVSLADGDCDDYDPSVQKEIQCKTRDGYVACTENSLCPSNMTCDKSTGSCYISILKTENESCFTSADCQGNLKCLNKQCVRNNTIIGNFISQQSENDYNMCQDECKSQFASSGIGNTSDMCNSMCGGMVAMSFFDQDSFNETCKNPNSCPNDCDCDGITDFIEKIYNIDPFISYKDAPEMAYQNCLETNKNTWFEGQCEYIKNDISDYGNWNEYFEIVESLRSKFGKQNFDPGVCGDFSSTSAENLNICLEFFKEMNDLGLQVSDISLLDPTGMFELGAVTLGFGESAINQTYDWMQFYNTTGIPPALSPNDFRNYSTVEAEELDDGFNKVASLYGITWSNKNNEEFKNFLSDFGLYYTEHPIDGLTSDERFELLLRNYFETEYNGNNQDKKTYEEMSKALINYYQCTIESDTCSLPEGAITSEEISVGNRYINSSNSAQGELLLTWATGISDVGDFGKLAYGLARRAILVTVGGEIAEAYLEKIGKELGENLSDRVVKEYAELLGQGASQEELVELLVRNGISENRALSATNSVVVGLATDLADEVRERMVKELGENASDPEAVASWLRKNGYEELVPVSKSTSFAKAFDFPDFDKNKCDPISFSKNNLVFAVQAFPKCVSYHETIGRAQAGGDPRVSKEHVSLNVDGGFLTITSLSRSNPVLVENKGVYYLIQPDKTILHFNTTINQWETIATNSSALSLSAEELQYTSVYLGNSIYAPRVDPYQAFIRNKAKSIAITDPGNTLDPTRREILERHAVETSLDFLDFFERRTNLTVKQIEGFRKRAGESIAIHVDTHREYNQLFPNGNADAYATRRIHLIPSPVSSDYALPTYLDGVFAHELGHIMGQKNKTLDRYYQKMGDYSIPIVEGFNELASAVASERRTVAYPEYVEAATKLYQEVLRRKGQRVADTLLALHLIGDFDGASKLVGESFQADGDSIYRYYFNSFAYTPVRNENLTLYSENSIFYNNSTEKDNNKKEKSPLVFKTHAQENEIEENTTIKNTLYSDSAIIISNTSETLTLSLGNSGTANLNLTNGYYNLQIIPFNKSLKFVKNSSDGIEIAIPVDKEGNIIADPQTRILKGDINSIKINSFIDKNKNGQQDNNEQNYSIENTILFFDRIIQPNKYNLTTGWNMISVPIEIEDFKAKDLLLEITNQGGYASTVAKYNNGMWVSYKIRGEEVYADENFDIKPTEGYLVYVGQPTYLQLAGKPLEEIPEINFSSTWNLVGFTPALNEDNIYYWEHEKSDEETWKSNDILEILQEEGYEAIVISDWNNGSYKNYIKNNGEIFGFDFDIDKNKGYFIRVNNYRSKSKWKF